MKGTAIFVFTLGCAHTVKALEDSHVQAVTTGITVENEHVSTNSSSFNSFLEVRKPLPSPTKLAEAHPVSADPPAVSSAPTKEHHTHIYNFKQDAVAASSAVPSASSSAAETSHSVTTDNKGDKHGGKRDVVYGIDVDSVKNTLALPYNTLHKYAWKPIFGKREAQSP